MIRSRDGVLSGRNKDFNQYHNINHKKLNYALQYFTIK